VKVVDANMVAHDMLQLCSTKYFYSELHITLECKDIKLWPIFGCITMSLLMLGDFLKFSYEEPLVLILKIIIFGSNFGKKKHGTLGLVLEAKLILCFISILEIKPGSDFDLVF
jgi:hypothetical protein